MDDETLQKLISVRSRVELKKLFRTLGLSREEATAKVREIFDSKDDDDDAEEKAAAPPPPDGPLTAIAKAFRSEVQKEEERRAWLAEVAQVCAEQVAIMIGKFSFDTANSWIPGRDKRQDWHPTARIADRAAVGELVPKFTASFEAAVKDCATADALEAALTRFDFEGLRLPAKVIKGYTRAYGPAVKATEVTNGI